jgi:hypothetical protein
MTFGPHGACSSARALALALAATAAAAAVGACGCGERRAREASAAGPAAPATRGLGPPRPAAAAPGEGAATAGAPGPRPLRASSLEEELRARAEPGGLAGGLAGGGAAGAGLGGGGAQTWVETYPVAGERPRDDRDLGAELRAALGSPEGCVRGETMTRLGGRLDVQVTATVGPSGRVSTASVGAPGLSAEERACLERRAGGVVLRGPVEGAPRRVSTTLAATYRATPPPPPRDVPPPPIPLPPGARPPSHALPAQVGDGPAPGSVAPRIVLPAQVGDGPAPGSVAPRIVLPARGPSGSSRPVTNDITARPPPQPQAP